MWTLIQRLEGGYVKSYALPAADTITVSENDALALWTVADGDTAGNDMTIWLSDTPFPVEVASPGVAQAGFWFGSEGQQTQERHVITGQSLVFCKPLMNRFGQCRIRVQTDTAGPDLLATLDVNSAKLTPDELTDLLTYLLNRGVSYWRSEVGMTTVSVGEGSARSPLHRLAQVGRDLTELEHLWPAFRDQPQTRLEPQQAFETARTTDWTEQTLRYQAQHPETLRPAQPTDDGAFRWSRRWLAASHTLTNRLTATTDTLENRTLHGYLYHLLDWLKQELHQLPTNNGTGPALLTSANAALLRQWQQEHYAQRVGREISRLINQASGLLQRYEEHLPVRELLIGLPPGMAGFTASDHYFQAGQLLLRWYDRIGEAPDDRTDGLSGVRTLDRLYELLCLFKIQDALTELDYRLDRYDARRVNNPDLMDDDRTGTYYFTHPVGHLLRLHYELVPDTYVNVGRVRDLLPDFILEFLPAEGEPRGIIMDAKYRRYWTIVRHEYADLTLKYLHGLVPRAGLSSRTAQRMGRTTGPIRTEALLVLHPTDDQAPPNYNGASFYQKDRYDAFASQTSRPLIGTVEVAASARPPAQLVRVLRALMG